MYRLKANGDKTILELLREKNIYIDAPCGGKGTCGKCSVKIISGDILEDSKIKKVENETVLACKTVPFSEINLDDDFIEESRIFNSQDEIIVLIDLGTTTIEIEIYDYKTEEKKENISFYNPQRNFGADIISRLEYIKNSKNNFEKLHKILIDSIKSKIKGEIKKLYIAGNTVMQHIFLGIYPEKMFRPPFEAEFYDYQIIKKDNFFAEELIVMPNLASFVGGDTYSVLVALDYENEDIEKTVIIDLGTNGEIVVVNNGEYYISSTAAGPAFEGASIECGSRARKGALKAVRIDERLEIETIGDEKLNGICGSGLINLVSELLYTETMEKSGLIKNENILYPFLNNRIKGSRIYLNDEIYLSQNDIRELQTAKSAIKTAVEILLIEADLKKEDIKKIILTGNFGKALNKKNLKKIKILPNIKDSKIKIKENLVLKGLRAHFRDLNTFSYCGKIKKKLKHVELSIKPVFGEKFLENMNF